MNRISVKSSNLLIVSILLIAGVGMITNSAQAISNIPLSNLLTTNSPIQINLPWSAPNSNENPSLIAYEIVFLSGNGTQTTTQGVTVPTPPTSLSVTSSPPNSIFLTWNLPQSNGGSPILGYEVDYKTSTSNFWFVLVQNTGLSTSYVQTGLVPGNTYSYRVLAINSIGSSLPSNEASITPNVQPTQQNYLPAGSSIFTGQQSPGNINSALFSNSGPQTKYFSSPSDQVNGIWTTVSTYVSGAILYFDFNGNTYSTNIYPNSNTLISFSGPTSISNVRVSIQDRGSSNDIVGVAYVSSANPRYPLVPDAPQSLFANLYSQNNVQISWIAPQNIGKPPILGYKIEYKTSTSNFWFVLVQNTGLSTINVHSGLAPSSTYSYRVSAINSIGTSLPSNEASVTTGSFTSPPPPISHISSGTIPIVGTDTSISYVISGDQVSGAAVNKNTNSLDFQLQGMVDGQLFVQMPRTLIDAKQSDGSDKTFSVILDNNNAQFTETKTDTYRTLVVSFPANANHISIIGTTVVPEFPIALIALVIGLVPTIFISRRLGKF